MAKFDLTPGNDVLTAAAAICAVLDKQRKETADTSNLAPEEIPSAFQIVRLISSAKEDMLQLMGILEGHTDNIDGSITISFENAKAAEEFLQGLQTKATKLQQAEYPEFGRFLTEHSDFFAKNLREARKAAESERGSQSL